MDKQTDPFLQGNLDALGYKRTEYAAILVNLGLTSEQATDFVYELMSQTANEINDWYRRLVSINKVEIARPSK